MQDDALSLMENVTDAKFVNSLSTDVFQRSPALYFFILLSFSIAI